MPFLTNGLKKAIVLRPSFQDLSAEIEDRRRKQALLYKIENVENPTRSAIAIIKGMNALELMMDECHFDERVGIDRVGAVDEVEEFVEEPFNFWAFLGRRVNRYAN
jgi:hypothetical protein